jgi:hypothetical protein
VVVVSIAPNTSISAASVTVNFSLATLAGTVINTSLTLTGPFTPGHYVDNNYVSGQANPLSVSGCTITGVTSDPTFTYNTIG